MELPHGRHPADRLRGVQEQYPPEQAGSVVRHRVPAHRGARRPVDRADPGEGRDLLHEPNVSVMYEAITGQKADEFLKWFETISISALSRNKRGQLFHELIDNVRISPSQIEIEIKADCFAAAPIARETH